MPPNITLAAFVFGAVLLLIGLVGGKFKIFGAEVSGTAGRAGRWFATTAGTLLVLVGLFFKPQSPRAASIRPQPMPDVQGPAHTETVRILSFQATPAEIKERETTQLHWSVADASNVVIDHEVGAVPLTGARAVSPTTTTAYTLSASQGSVTIKATTQVNVKPLTWEDKNSTGSLPGDAIERFRVLTYSDQSAETELVYHVNPQHGQAWIGAYLLDENDGSISHGFRPTSADPTGVTRVMVNADPSKGRIQSKWIVFWIYESNKGEGFVSRRFSYDHWWN